MVPIVTNEAAINVLTAKQTLLANMVLRLAQSTLAVLGPQTTKADLVLAEATFTGYVAKTVVAPPLPYLVPGQGGNLQIPTQQFQPTGTAIQNMIRAWWVELATGEIQLAGQFDSDIPMGQVTDAIPLDIIFRQPNQ